MKNNQHQQLIEREITQLPEALQGSVMQAWSEFISLESGVAIIETMDELLALSLPRVWAGSAFVSRICLNRPQLLKTLISSGELMKPYRQNELTRKVEALCSSIRDEVGLASELRQIRQREALRIAWRDLAGWADLKEVTHTLSDLADGLLHQAHSLAHQLCIESYGAPQGGGDGSNQLVVLGLGKLGGRELNFSSDIDLIFAYPEEGTTSGRNPLSNHEFFTKVGHRIIKFLDANTSEGFVFRVDMRLRPNGANGPLVLSFDAMEHYYQTHGRDWERYALIKARRVAGPVTEGRQLLDNLKPFVYRRYLDFGAFEAIRSMKQMIERELRRKGIEDNVKLGAGGIREIEFIAQSYQLIRGGREHQLQTQSLHTAFDELENSGVMSKEDIKILITGYHFLRATEHRLQMVQDQQTHLLPAETNAQQRLAFSMGFPSWRAFESDLRSQMLRIHSTFTQVFSINPEQSDPKDRHFFTDIWHNALSEDECLRLLKQCGYRDPESVCALLDQLRNGSTYRSYSSTGRDRLDRLMPKLLDHCSTTETPEETFARATRVVSAIGRRSAYLSLLIENPLALEQFIRLCTASPWITNWIGQHPIVLDELLDPITNYQPLTREILTEDLALRFNHLPVDDLEQQMDLLREVHHGHLLRIAAADIADIIDSGQVGQQLAILAESVLTEALQLAKAGLRHKLELPSFGDPKAPPEFGIFAYGKLAGEELGYHSDLDIIFLLNHSVDDRYPPETGYYFARLAQRLVHILTTRTQAGMLYEIDMRLRPSGRSGTLVSSISGFAAYQLNKAWTWEHQALVRARPVVSSNTLSAEFEKTRKEVLTLPRDPAILSDEIVTMRTRMASNDRSDEQWFDLKLGRGGIVDIEFIVQYCVLRWAHNHPELTAPRSNVVLLETLGSSGVLESAKATALKMIYSELLAMEQRLKLQELPPMVEQQLFVTERQQVIGLWDELLLKR